MECWSYTLWKFDEALTALPAEAKNKETPCAAEEELQFCNQLFAIERKLKDVSPDERQKEPFERSQPVLHAFITWNKVRELHLKVRTSHQILPESVVASNDVFIIRSLGNRK